MIRSMKYPGIGNATTTSLFTLLSTTNNNTSTLKPIEMLNLSYQVGKENNETAVSTKMMIDVVSLTVKEDFHTLFNNSALKSWIRHIANIRTITFIGRESDYEFWHRNMQIHFPHDDDNNNKTYKTTSSGRNESTYLVSGMPCRWVNETHWTNKYRRKYSCGYPGLCQQFIKLHVFDLNDDMNVDLLDNVLIIDSDTVWARDIEFVHEDQSVTYVALMVEGVKPTLCTGGDSIMFQERFTAGPISASNQSMAPYPWCHRNESNKGLIHYDIRHSQQLGLPFQLGERHIVHHMLFQRDVMEHMHQSIQTLWNVTSLWHAALKCRKLGWCYGRVSEYELYYSWVYHQFPQRVQVKYEINDRTFMTASGFCNSHEMDCCHTKKVLLKGCHDHRIKIHSKAYMCCPDAIQYGI